MPGIVENCPTRVLRTSFYFCIYVYLCKWKLNSMLLIAWMGVWSSRRYFPQPVTSLMLSSGNMCLASWELFQMNAVCWSEKVWCPQSRCGISLVSSVWKMERYLRMSCPAYYWVVMISVKGNKTLKWLKGNSSHHSGEQTFTKPKQ